MTAPATQTRIVSLKIVLYFVCATLFILVNANTVFANHGSGQSSGSPESGREICQGAGNDEGTNNPLPDRDNPDGPTGNIVWAGGLYVPVKDFEAEAVLQDIAGTLRAMNRDLEFIQTDTQAIRYLLYHLCMKEYVYDHTIQHAWRDVIGQFVETTREWVRTVYNNNPIFLTNQTIYYQIVDRNVIEIFKREIMASNLGSVAQQKILQEIERRVDEEFFPYYGDQTLAPDGLSDQLTRPTEFNWEDWNSLMVRSSNNISSLSQLAFMELGRKRQRMLAYEQEKLAWGDGFFSYELCDLDIYIRGTGGPSGPTDRRNCRIVTPGSLIQDQVSLVFGSAIRQMEEADEFEEWVSENAVLVLNDILNDTGLVDTTRTGGTAPIDPTDAGTQIQSGTRNAPIPDDLERDQQVPPPEPQQTP